MIEDIPTLTSDSGWLVIWNDIKNFGSGFWVFLFLINFYLLKEQIKDFFKFLLNTITFKKNVITYTKKDLLKHPIFKDLDYWLKIGIDALHLKENIHPDEDEYLANKEKMAKEVIRIKYTTMKESLSMFIDETDIDNIDSDLACVYLIDCLTKNSITQKRKFNERGIPLKFLNKFYVISDISKKIIYNAIRNFFSKSCEANTATKIYMAFNTLDGYLNVVFNDLCETMSTINGDLKTEIFDGKPMGRPQITTLKPPHPTYPLIVKEKLAEILQDFNGSRAMISKYYIKNNEHMHSVVYESTINGVTSEIANIQQISDEHEKNILNIMNESGSIAADISKFSSNTIERLNRRGTKAIIIAPIYNNEKIDGALSIDYISIENFDNIANDKKFNLDEKLKRYTEELAPYIQYPENYVF